MLREATYRIDTESFYTLDNFEGADSFYISCRNWSKGFESRNEVLFPGLAEKNCWTFKLRYRQTIRRELEGPGQKEIESD